MRQRARMAMLVVVLLLTAIGTASAECAWVLWVGEWYDAGVGHPWSVLHAATARDDCLNAMRRAAEAYKQQMGTEVAIGRDARDPWALFVSGQSHSVTLRCLPDTVDPRTPKR